MAFDEITSAAIEFGFERASSDQRAALEAFMSGSDVLVFVIQLEMEVLMLQDPAYVV